MIKCLYCGYECPDTANICPNCGKPIIKTTSGNQPTFNDIKEAHLREKTGIKQEETNSKKQVIIAACVLLISALLIYKFM
ncbi:hypothetical protein SOV_18010 [Sporomusa ovata DSM 2662]|uniref:Zinc-ribbon domain-containing protein n=1 Tax=Sporomusa ovata TaxID=2378 RepID=A0A0U1KVI5_9FIRM|nr:zinc ribbon domain-containing protein [Sporomusa ovata]EQB29400.1 zinc-ribbon domain containing protein [Sporomusa ovata DSM 2662]CQR71448.1 hypothetical protein SpAn4DRAFT_3953 [Sporomusa ovata]